MWRIWETQKSVKLLLNNNCDYQEFFNLILALSSISPNAYSLTDPAVAIQMNGGNASLTWNSTPIGAVDVEHSPDLSEWASISSYNANGLFCHSIGSSAKGFYRLKPKPFDSSGIMVTTLAGIGRAVDGIRSGASFSLPFGVATDSLGNVFVADSVNAKIRKINPEGVVTTIAGSGFAQGPTEDGPAKSASFRQPEGIAVDSSGTVYVADTWDHKIRKITPDGMVSTLAGSGVEGDQDGLGNQASGVPALGDGAAMF
jgi:hypothetical protein